MRNFLSLLTIILFLPTCFAAAPEPAVGEKHMVVSAQHLATKVGNNILNQGGNAVDAAVGVAYALAVVHPCCGNIGGGGFMLIRLATGNTTFVNFREKAPLAATPDKFENGQYKNKPYLTVAVPGTVSGLNTALKEYGTMPIEKVIRPAIELAQKGFTLSRQGAKLLGYNTKTFSSQPNVSSIFLPFNKPLKPGHQLIQPGLARTLFAISKKGSDAFYKGILADKMSMASEDNNGLMTKKDLAQYNTEESQPITCNYRGYHIITSPPPSAGGITICEILNILEPYPLSKMGFHSAASTHLTIEAMRHAFADRAQHLGDPNFVQNPTQELISKSHAETIRKNIDENKAGNSKVLADQKQNEKPNTTAFVVLDNQGNAVSVTYTLNGFFGAKVIAEDTGFFLNNEMSDFNLQPGKPNFFGLIQGNANRVAPGKRPLSSMAPTIITKDGKLFMILSAPGGSTIPTQLIAVIQNVIDYGMNIQEAVDAPRFHMQQLPDVTFYEPFSFSADTMSLLKKMGHQFKLGSPYDTDHWGAVMAILIDPKTGEIQGAADSRRPAGAAMSD